MKGEVIYTSAPRGLRPGTSGFCTVAATRGLPRRELQRLEGMSGYEFAFGLSDPRADQNPIAHVHTAFVVDGQAHDVLSRVAFAGADHTGRSNKIAHHILVDRSERSPEGPASMLRGLEGSVFVPRWDRQPEDLEPRKLPVLPRPREPHGAWASAAGDAGWGGALARAFRERPHASGIIVFNPGTDVLALFEESLAVLPQGERWTVCFSTYYTGALPPDLPCHWRGVLAGSPAAEQARRHPDALIIDLTKPLGPAAKDDYADAARGGRTLEARTPATNSPKAEVPSERKAEKAGRPERKVELRPPSGLYELVDPGEQGGRATHRAPLVPGLWPGSNGAGEQSRSSNRGPFLFIGAAVALAAGLVTAVLFRKPEESPKNPIPARPTPPTQPGVPPARPAATLDAVRPLPPNALAEGTSPIQTTLGPPQPPPSQLTATQGVPPPAPSSEPTELPQQLSAPVPTELTLHIERASPGLAPTDATVVTSNRQDATVSWLLPGLGPWTLLHGRLGSFVEFEEESGGVRIFQRRGGGPPPTIASVSLSPLGSSTVVSLRLGTGVGNVMPEEEIAAVVSSLCLELRGPGERVVVLHPGPSARTRVEEISLASAPPALFAVPPPGPYISELVPGDRFPPPTPRFRPANADLELLNGTDARSGWQLRGKRLQACRGRLRDKIAALDRAWPATAGAAADARERCRLVDREHRTWESQCSEALRDAENSIDACREELRKLQSGGGQGATSGHQAEAREARRRPIEERRDRAHSDKRRLERELEALSKLPALVRDVRDADAACRTALDGVVAELCDPWGRVLDAVELKWKSPLQ